VNNNITVEFGDLEVCRVANDQAGKRFNKDGRLSMPGGCFVDRGSGASRAPAEEDVDLLRAILDIIPQPIIAVDNKAMPLFTNAAAHELLKKADGPQIKHSRLTAYRARDGRRLAACIEHFANGSKREPRAGKWIRLERRTGTPYALFMAPLRCGKPSSSAKTPVVIVVLDLQRQSKITPEVLRELFGLTPAEARLSCSLLGGESLNSAAEILHVSLNTVRAQIRSVFTKLHITRQQHLVRLLAALTAFDTEVV
jgi:DNA-binding CsgD family transcriptional regulator